MTAPGLVMIDPFDSRRTVWVRSDDRVEFEKRGYKAVPDERERKPARRVDPRPPAAAETEAAEDAPEVPSGDASSAAEALPTAAVEEETADEQPGEPEATPAVSFPRKRGKNSAPRG